MKRRDQTGAFLAALVLALSASAGSLADRWVYFYGDLADDGVAVRFTNLVDRAAQAGFNGVVIACDAEFAFEWDDARKSKYRAALRTAADAKMDVVPMMWSIGYGSMLGKRPDFVETRPLRGLPYVVRDGQIVFDAASAGAETKPITKVPRGAGAPFRIRRADTGVPCAEGRDYRTPPKMTEVQVKPDDKPLVFEAVKGGCLKDGDRLIVDGAIPSMAEMFDYSPYGQYSACMSDPALYAYFEKSAAGVEDVFHPRKWFLSMDEVRNGGTCDACRARKTDMAHIFADCVARQAAIIRRVHPGAALYMWSDMCDPNHNAHDNYYSCKGTFSNSWDLVSKDIVQVNWNQDICKTSMAFFDAKGFKTFGSSCCDGDKGLKIAHDWIDACRETRNVTGVMYTTWGGDYSLLPEFGKLMKQDVDMPVKWDERLFTERPKVWAPPEYATNGMKAVFYENVPFRGRETRVFAYVGVPKSSDGKPVPGMVLVHGGGGSAFYRWVKYWNDRGYAAISMDWNGCVSGNVKGIEQYPHETHKWSGPKGCHSWNEMDDPVEDQWPYHAVAAIIRAHTLLASAPGVDKSRIGLTGVSWGGFLSCIAAGADPRFAFVAPIYGCGYIAEHSMWVDEGYSDGRMLQCSPDKVLRYDATWDPKHYLPFAKMPFLFIDGTNDHAYPLDIVEKSRRLLKTECTRVIIPRMPHHHGADSERPAELFAYADGRFGRGAGLPRCRFFSARTDWSGIYDAKFDLKGDAIASASFEYTSGTGDCRKREWKSIPAAFSNDCVWATPPKGTTSFFFSIRTARGLRATSDAVVSPPRLGGMKTLYNREPTEANIRNGEGDTVLLKDGRMLFAWSYFTNRSAPGNTSRHLGTDGYSASIYKLVSPDGGKTWPGEPKEMIPNDAGLNLMSVSFLRLKDGRLVLFYLKKDRHDDCRPMMRVSTDEGETWSAPVKCIDDAHREYYVMNNARAVQLSTGRIVLPLALHRYNPKWKEQNMWCDIDPIGLVGCAWSDDAGATWRIAKEFIPAIGSDGQRTGAQEPGLVELNDGRVMMYIRSDESVIRVSYSSDGCETWTSPVPGLGCAPDAPTAITKLPSGEWVMVYNDHWTREALWSYRTPLVIAVSEDEGGTWDRFRAIEDDVCIRSCCYPSVRVYGDKLIIAYYAGDGLTTMRMRSLPISEVLAGKFPRPAQAGGASASEAPPDLATREFVREARRLYLTPEYADCRKSIEKKYMSTGSVKHDVPQGGRVSATPDPNDVRWLNIPGIRNARDIGGWTGLKPGRAYRGTQLFRSAAAGPSGISEETKRAILELGIKTELDLRGCIGEGVRSDETVPLSDVGPKFIRVPMTAYMKSFEGEWEEFRKALIVFTKAENYPIYFHCVGGGDRTGTLAMVLEGLCGVNETDLAIDYELTSVSAQFGNDSRRPRTAELFGGTTNRDCWWRMMEAVKSYKGKTLQEKFANCAKHLWRLTDEDIASIRANLMP
ncbi:MAG: exo-alpha-sialidase [Kiritimatiellae bacterium]|nr:exo-alpha-sialidase [Kiritimatiellia bacterium]